MEYSFIIKYSTSNHKWFYTLNSEFPFSVTAKTCIINRNYKKYLPVGTFVRILMHCNNAVNLLIVLTNLTATHFPTLEKLRILNQTKAVLTKIVSPLQHGRLERASARTAGGEGRWGWHRPANHRARRGWGTCPPTNVGTRRGGGGANRSGMTNWWGQV